MRKWLVILIAVVFIATVNAGGSKEVSITIYNNDLGLVKDVRSLEFKRGINNIDFDEVASRIDPTSVNFRCIDDKNVAVLEQNFLYDLVSTDALLKRYLGKNIEVIAEDDRRYRGELLSFDGKNVILGSDDGEVMMVSLAKIADYTFPSLPEGLMLKPTLCWLADSPSGGAKRCEVSYLTNGINWHADYVAVASADDRQLDLSGWVTINNKSGATYEDATLKLVAGDVHRVEERRRPRMDLAEAKFKGGAGRPQFEEEEFFEYHLYSLSRPATINDKEIKQLSLFPSTRTKVKKVYIFDAARQVYFRTDGDKIKIKVNLEFENSEEAGLGIPLPKGKIRVYKADLKGALQFIGEDLIDHTPKDEKVRVYLGDAFDITGTRKKTNIEDLGKDRVRESYEIVLKNHKKEDIVVTVVEHTRGWREWEIKRSSLEYRKIDNYRIEFDVEVAAESEATLTYTIQYY
ncbi:MAG: hypothetical protein B6D58_02285 [candidate division Zixibacteria bacterium 4484_95]|nr:MAG: hypothetical protein B6D58_02285 [candidate division Zixibacteria bacterium 4484_95]RKX21188.1 MAG: DUF4139 domain-containing protein [candidate division Zixibacteria bacterium]